MIVHDFYCVKCGNKGIPISRKPNKFRSKMHLKELWCVYCKDTINHVECTSEEDVKKFLRRFEEGYYIGKEKKNED